MSEVDIASNGATDIASRLDRLPSTPRLWSWVMKVSLGGFFEVYDLALTALLSPLWVKAGLFRETTGGFFGLPDQASFAFATMLGLYVGSLGCSVAADRYSRRSTFLAAMLWYALGTVLMGLQQHALGLCIWRFIASIGIGAELVVVDCYLAEISPKAMRGRVFSISKAVQLSAIPLAGLLAKFLGPHDWLGIAGWRWLAFLPSIGALAVIMMRRGIPESPRWLASKGRLLEARNIVEVFEKYVIARGETLLPATVVPSPPKQDSRFSDLFRWPHRKRVLMLIVATPASSIAFYGFAQWAPTLLEHQGASITKSFLYVAMIGVAYPLSPLFASLFSDRIERKWQIAITGFFVATFGVLFAQQSFPLMWVILGVLLTLSSEMNSTANHTYRSELFPTSLRARAIGFVYSFDRLGTAFSSYLIATVLLHAGVRGVFWLLALFMGICVFTTLLFGPRTLGRAYEEIDVNG